MKKNAHRHDLQGGYTLVELLIASALGALLMTALTSVVLTSWRASMIAAGRVEASSEVRNFEIYAYDDFARSTVPGGGGCAPASPCTTQPLTLTGFQVSNGTPVPASYSVSYTWDGSAFLDRSVSGSGVSRHTASDVTGFSWYVDTNSTVVITLTVTVNTYSESETFRFHPQMNP